MAGARRRARLEDIGADNGVKVRLHKVKDEILRSRALVAAFSLAQRTSKRAAAVHSCDATARKACVARTMSLSFSAFKKFCSLMMFACGVGADNACRYMISRNVRCASVAFWNASKIFFSATVCLVFLSTALKTTAYAPSRAALLSKKLGPLHPRHQQLSRVNMVLQL